MASSNYQGWKNLFGLKGLIMVKLIVRAKQQKLWQRFGTSKMHVSPPPRCRSKTVVLLLLMYCLLLVSLFVEVLRLVLVL